MDLPQFSLELLLYSEWFSIKLLNELGSYSHLPVKCIVLG